MIFVPIIAARVVLDILEAGLDAVHRFTHETLHPLVFGCCPIDHPLREREEIK